MDDATEYFKPNQRLILSALVIIICLNIDSGLLLGYLDFQMFSFNLDLRQHLLWSYFLVIFSFLVLINALNLMDGINLISSAFFTLIIIVFYYFNILNIVIFSLIPFFIFFFFYNFKSKIFLGSSGIMPLSFLIGYFFIKGYNFGFIKYSDWVFIILSVPLIELIRIMTLRLLNKKNPFLPDKNHLHHYLLLKNSQNKTILILVLIYFIPSVILLTFQNSIYSILITIILYFSLLLMLKKI